MGLFIVIGIILVFLLIWFIGAANSFARISVKTKESESGIDVALTKRYDVLSKMMDVCREYAGHEADTLANVIELRKGMTMQERSAACAEMDKATAGINVLAESYPELRSSEVFRELQRGIRDVEENLQAARRFYNTNVSDMNQRLAVFPKSIVGSMKGYKPFAFFEAEEHKRSDVSMKLK